MQHYCYNVVLTMFYTFPHLPRIVGRCGRNAGRLRQWQDMHTRRLYPLFAPMRYDAALSGITLPTTA